jgi:hypothetical protein
VIEKHYTSAPWLDVPLADICVFSSLREIWPELESTYYGDFKAMVLGDDIPSMESLVESMSIIHKQLIKLDDSLK